MNGLEIILSLIEDKHTWQGVVFGELSHGTYRPGCAQASPAQASPAQASPAHTPPAQAFSAISHMDLYVIVLRGRMKSVINGVVHISTARKKNLVNVRSADAVTDIRLSGDFHGYVLAVPHGFTGKADKAISFHGVTPFHEVIHFHGVMPMRGQHAVTIAKNDMETIADYYRLMEKNCKPKDNPLDRSIFRFAVQLCHLKILQQLFSAKEYPAAKPNATRASMLCARFFGLLERHVETEHRVGFYAGALSITPHYLTRITNEFAGLPANRIIADELISRACGLLHNPEYTLQQIADRLCFHDQSSFGKFFRKHTGKTPNAYRKDSPPLFNV